MRTPQTEVANLLTNSVKAWRGITFLICKKVDDSIIPLGTAFSLGGKYVATNEHLINGQGDLCLSISPSAWHDWIPTSRLAYADPVRVTVIAQSFELDIAILEAEFSSPPVIPLLVDNRINMGTSVGFVGFPFAPPPTMRLNLVATHGMIASLIETDRFGVGVKTIQIDAMSHEGNSGGPLFLATTGALIGIMARRYDPLSSMQRALTLGDVGIIRDRTNIAFAIFIDHLLEVIPPAVGAKLNIIRTV
jgi:S1-C subfamily serine protease